MNQLYGYDAFSPKEIAERVQTIGVAKARMPFVQTAMLGILAGVFISLGSIFFVTILSDSQLHFGVARLLGGLAFSLGLVMVVIAGAELFTGNNLIIMALADKRITVWDVLRNWGIVAVSNLVGAVGISLLLVLSKQYEINNGAVGELYLKIAATKCSISVQQAFFSGVFCNIYVCLAVWMAQAGRSVIDKVVVILFPVTAFVASGFEHSIANMFFISMGLFLKTVYPVSGYTDAISVVGMCTNLIPVVAGNLVGGSMFVGLVYYLIYGRTKNSNEHQDSR